MTNDYFYSLYKTRYLRHSKKQKGGSMLLLYKLIFIVRSLVRLIMVRNTLILWGFYENSEGNEKEPI